MNWNPNLKKRKVKSTKRTPLKNYRKFKLCINIFSPNDDGKEDKWKLIKCLLFIRTRKDDLKKIKNSYLQFLIKLSQLTFLLFL